MTTPASVATLSKKECEELYNNRIDDGVNPPYYKNPLTGKKIQENGPTYKMIKKHCDPLLNITNTSIPSSRSRKTLTKEEKIEKWLKNPLKDPETGRKINVNFKKDSPYRKYYDEAYEHFKNLGLPNYNIKTNLPINHYLFNNTFDILYINSNIKYNTESYTSNNKIIYNFILNQLESLADISSKRLGYPDDLNIGDFEENEKKIFYSLLKLFSKHVANYLRYLNIILKKNYTLFDNYINDIENIIKDIKMIHEILNRFGLESIFKSQFSLSHYGDTLVLVEIFNLANVNNDDIDLNRVIIKYNRDVYLILQKSLTTNGSNIINKILEHYEEIYKIFNYKNDNKNSPFENIENKKYNKIEDPLISIINKLLSSGSINNLDLNNLDLPKRIYKNDAEFDKIKKEYDTKQTSYDKKLLDYDKEYKTLKETTRKSPSPTVLEKPKRPTIIIPKSEALPYGKTLFIGQPLPKHIKDNDYSNLEKTYKENEHIIKLYKELINVGLLDILKKNTEYKSPSFKYELLNKDREYFEENIFEDGTDDKKKCNSNIDALSQDEFDSDKYLLARLQLMYQLHTKNNDGEVIRTDCFYAPNMYNYIVSKVNTKETIVNPLTKQPISDEDIDNLMKIMKLIDPSIEKPIYIKPIHDKEFKIEHDEIFYKNHRYYKVYLSRKIGPFYITILNLCYIPADIEHTETGSTDIASSVFLFSIYRLFNEGKLLKTYMPPYNIDGHYVKPMIHFNNYNTLAKWDKQPDEKMRMFIHYLDEIKQNL